MKRYCWLVQDNQIEATDQIFLFSSKVKALAWILEETGEDYYSDKYKNEYYLVRTVIS